MIRKVVADSGNSGVDSKGASNVAADPQKVAQLINGCQGLVRTIAWRVHQRLPKTVDLDDLIGYGQVGLAEAARDFDEGKGSQFVTYAWYRVRGAILDGLSRMTWFSPADYHSGRYEAAANAVLTTELGNADGTQQVDWFTRTSRSLGAAFVLTAFSGMQGEPGEPAIEDPRSPLESHELRDSVQKAIATLPDAERGMIEGVYFEGLTITQAGDRQQIDKSWASRLHGRALELLAAKLSDNSPNFH